MNARARSSDILMLSKMQDASVKVAEEGGRGRTDKWMEWLTGGGKGGMHNQSMTSVSKILSGERVSSNPGMEAACNVRTEGREGSTLLLSPRISIPQNQNRSGLESEIRSASRNSPRCIAKTSPASVIRWFVLATTPMGGISRAPKLKIAGEGNLFAPSSLSHFPARSAIIAFPAL